LTRYRGVSAEKIAASILEKLGFEVIDWRRRVFIKGERVAEVDLVVRDKEGKEYCVEVKAGRIGASDIKHAYANAKILNMEPIIVGKGFADKSAEVLAEKLGVNVVKLSDYYVLLDLETLDKVVRESLREEVINAFTQILELLLNPPTRYLNVLEVIAESETLKQAAEKLGANEKFLGKVLSEIKREYSMFSYFRGYDGLRRGAKLALNVIKLAGKIKQG